MAAAPQASERLLVASKADSEFFYLPESEGAVTWNRVKQIRDRLESILLPTGCKLSVLVTANEETERICVLLQNPREHTLYMPVKDVMSIDALPGLLYAVFLELDRYNGIPPTHFEINEVSGSFRERSLKDVELFDVSRN